MIRQGHEKMRLNVNDAVIDYQLGFDNAGLFLTVNIELPLCPHVISTVDGNINRFNDLTTKARLREFFTFHVLLIEVFPLKGAIKSLKRLYVHRKSELVR